MTLLSDATLVLPVGVVQGGWVAIAAGRITAVGGPERSRPRDPDVLDLGGCWVVPGFVDLHVHGGGGQSYGSGEPAAIGAISSLHRAHGTTSALASLATAPLDEMLRAAAALADVVEAGTLTGIHAEGPFLSPAHAGEQDPAAMLVPDADVLTQLINACRGHLRVLTLAPELPGALELVRRAVDRGVAVAVGHTGAGYERTLSAIDAGATLATHLFHAQPGPTQREPGAVGALLEHPDVVVQLIADGIHLHDALLAMVFRLCGAERVALVTDAMAAAGVGDGRYEVGSRQVEVRGGVALVEGTGAVAGSTLTQDAALRRAVDAGVPLLDVVTALSATPARAIGIGDRVGALVPGLAADLLVLGPGLEIDGVMVGGSWLRAPH
ncbi:N-acetylglucosamine-6-phosphate deacetylase [Cryptosporangium aurantiacum]|uniref:N-acetylglucosamine 6-phosphate deacetylase n=1 Tax=Cryptosporangium aurantiacum TaxID=134849 RepID=A0A1M7N368_9ACTN|nr:N-acetylglucosamine-6-phosphate deacetylase [Cryptosporangium aurantiacum]SHM97877.1 N-acetylglucosamine 6-phosphate deacetylase [Cryptosporangium aurantiacum]